MQPLPSQIDSLAELDDIMTRPSPALVESVRGWKGDIVILGVAGKMGPTMARLARRAIEEAGIRARVIGVARFSDPTVREQLNGHGIETIAADLLDDAALDALPDGPLVIHLVAHKFGATGNPGLTWALNTYLPARVALRYKDSRIVTLSTGNVYPFWPADSSGPTEQDPVGPVGEYGQSALGRERLFEFVSRRHGTPVAIIRLNYAIDLRYGVLLDIAQKVWTNQPIDLAMGHVNVIWQGDANEAVLRSFEFAASPPYILNVTGAPVQRVRDLAAEFGRRLDRPPVFVGKEAETALLSNANQCIRVMGPPRAPLPQMLDWVAHWVKTGGPTLAKPTHFQTRDGRF